MFKVPNKYRVRTGMMGSDDQVGNCGAFDVVCYKKGSKIYKIFKPGSHRIILHCIASDGFEWEHVSCHKIYCKQQFIPTWSEMCFIKSLFWDEEDCVMQLHPPKENYVNDNPFVLHLWRPIDVEIPQPPLILV